MLYLIVAFHFFLIIGITLQNFELEGHVIEKANEILVHIALSSNKNSGEPTQMHRLSRALG